MSIAKLFSRTCGCDAARYVRREFGGIPCVSAVFALVFAAVWSVGCTPRVQGVGASVVIPEVSGQVIVVSDGQRLPVRVWRATGKETHVIVALHGFNDYSKAFSMPAEWWAGRGVTTYAYDQRGFGETTDPGIWPGTQNLVSDLFDVIRAVRARHGETPIFLAGSSMGGAVILAAYGSSLSSRGVSVVPVMERTNHVPPQIGGVILAAPAVWGRATMNPIYRAVLWLLVHVAPGARVSGKDLRITPSDNIEMLRALSRDPLVIKETRTDAVYGLVNLMDIALEAAGHLSIPALVLYGEKDEIIPRGATRLMIDRLDSSHRIALYPDGYHMLFRDYQAEVVWRDILTWIEDTDAPLPSGRSLEQNSLSAEN